MDFEDLLQMLANPGDDGLPDTFNDALRASYQNATTTRDAKIGELETNQGTMEAGHGEAIDAKDAVIATLNEELTKQKLINYELLMASPGDPEEDPAPKEEESDDDSFDSMFEE